MKSIYTDKNIVGSDWIVNNFSFVKKDETLCFVRYTSGIETKIVSPCDGYLLIQGESNLHWDKDDFSNKPLASVFDSIQELLSYEYCCEGSTLEIDPYTGLRKIEWKNQQEVFLGEFDNDGFSIDFYDDKTLLCFTKEDKLQIGDCVSFLFDDGEILDFPIMKKPVKDYGYKTSFVLCQEDAETLMCSSLVSYRISYKNESKRPETVKIGCSIWNGPEAIRIYVKNHLDTIKLLVPEYQLPRRTVEKTPIEYKFSWCYVYLMRDNTNCYHKIGISNKPEYREKTLQSEKPSIEMIACKKFPTRKIAEAIEAALHTAYSQQRVRGEWFNLNDEDVAAIIETLK